MQGQKILRRQRKSLSYIQTLLLFLRYVKAEEGGYTFTSAELEWVPQTMVSVAGADADKLDKLVENLEDLDDVQNVFHNGKWNKMPKMYEI